MQLADEAEEGGQVHGHCLRGHVRVVEGLVDLEEDVDVRTVIEPERVEAYAELAAGEAAAL